MAKNDARAITEFQAIRSFASVRWTALARKVAHRLSRTAATGQVCLAIGEDRSRWDEFSFCVQNGADNPQGEHLLYRDIRIRISLVVDNLPEVEARLLWLATAPDELLPAAARVDRSANLEPVKEALVDMARARNMERFAPAWSQ